MAAAFGHACDVRVAVVVDLISEKWVHVTAVHARVGRRQHALLILQIKSVSGFGQQQQHLSNDRAAQR